MSEGKKHGHNDAIRRYENMTPAEIDVELRNLGIDPAPTIEAVTKLVRDKMEERRTRGRLHRQETEMSGSGSQRSGLHGSAGPPHGSERSWRSFLLLRHVESTNC